MRYTACLATLFGLVCACTAKVPNDAIAADQTNVPEHVRETDDANVKEREPLPLFHPGYKDDVGSQEYSENTEANLKRFASLVSKTEKVVVRRSGFSKNTEVTLEFDDPQLIADVRWAFSGNLYEARRVTEPVMHGVTLELEDGQSIHLTPFSYFCNVTFPGQTWHIIGWTEQMQHALQPAFDEVNREYAKQRDG